MVSILFVMSMKLSILNKYSRIPLLSNAWGKSTNKIIEIYDTLCINMPKSPVKLKRKKWDVFVEKDLKLGSNDNNLIVFGNQGLRITKTIVASSISYWKLFNILVIHKIINLL